MKPSFSDTTLLSFYLWADNYLLDKGAAYITTSSQFYYQSDPSLPQYDTFVAPYRSFVWDSGVSGATVVTNLSTNLGPVFNGVNGAKIDYQNGRLLFPAGSISNAIVSGTYSFKEFNLYFANQTQEETVFSNTYYLNSRFGNDFPTNPVPTDWDPKVRAYNLVAPCIFISNVHTDNEPFAFGGLYATRMNITMNVLAENLGSLENALSLFTDAKDMCFPQVPMSVYPLDFYGNLKSGYNYQTILSQYGAVNNLYYIEKITASKVSDYAKMNESLFLGIIDVTVLRARTIH